MKKVILFIAFFNSLTVIAAEKPAFKRESVLPAELQAKATAALARKCDVFNIKEDITIQVQRGVDQRQGDAYYRSYFTANYETAEGAIAKTTIMVKSAQYDLDGSEVLRVRSLNSAACD